VQRDQVDYDEVDDEVLGEALLVDALVEDVDFAGVEAVDAGVAVAESVEEVAVDDPADPESLRESLR
jgi:hypothetical protein